MVEKRGNKIKEDLKDKIIDSLHLLDQQVFTEAVKKQNGDYAERFNSRYNEIKKNIQKAPDFLRTSLNRSLEDIRKKAENFGINFKK